MAQPNLHHIGPPDALLELHDATPVTVDGVGTGGILDLGGIGLPLSLSEGANMLAAMVAEISAFDVADGDENYKLTLQGSNVANFASGIVELAQIQVGDESTIQDVDVVPPVGRYIRPFTNWQAGTQYQFVRLKFDVSGATPSITANVRLAQFRG